MKVEIRSYYQDHENGELLATWTFNENRHAVCDDDFEQKSAGLHGIIGHGGRYYPEDGEAFLRALSDYYGPSTFVSALLIE